MFEVDNPRDRQSVAQGDVRHSLLGPSFMVSAAFINGIVSREIKLDRPFNSVLPDVLFQQIRLTDVAIEYNRVERGHACRVNNGTTEGRKRTSTLFQLGGLLDLTRYN